jgi:hypothetical protein
VAAIGSAFVTAVKARRTQGDGQADNTVHTILVNGNGQILRTNAWVSGLLGETMQ